MSKLPDEEALAVELAHSNISSKEGKALLKRRGSQVERSFAHVLDCGGERRTTLRGIENNRKRYLIATACFNLSLLMRTIFGVGTLKQFLANLNLSFNLLVKPILRLRKRLSDFVSLIFFLTCQRTLNLKFSSSI